MTTYSYDFDWADLAFSSKKAVNELNATFIAAPREISKARLAQLIKGYLLTGNLVLGVAKEDYVLGFEGQPQFKTLQVADVTDVISKVNEAVLPHKVLTLSYSQRDFKFLLEKLKFQKILLINGSWQYMFHTLPQYYVIASKKLNYEMLSPFASEREAINYAQRILPPAKVPKGSFSDTEMLELASGEAKQSFDYCFQTGATLGRASGKKYTYLTGGFNKVVPYQTYAMHNGSLREKHFSPPNDLNYYDTVHAEVELVVKAQQQKLDLKGTTLFINLLPCPSCARMLCETDIAEFVYREDHSHGYAVKILEAAGKKVTRVVQ